MAAKKSRRPSTILARAVREASRARDGVGLRNASGKLWLAVTDALRDWLASRGVPEERMPKNFRGYRYFLQKFGGPDFVRAFGFLYGYYHILGYYEEGLNRTAFRAHLPDARKFLRKLSPADGA